MSTETYDIPYGTRHIPAKIYRERRRNVRFSIGRKAAILRMPNLLLPMEQELHRNKFEAWVRKQLEENERLRTQFLGKIYQSGDELRVGNRTYVLSLQESEKKMHHAKMRDGVIYLELTEDTASNRQKAIRHLLSRVIAKDFKPEVAARVKELNARFFQKEIKSINLKYNKTNWGSCSTRGNVNLSTRLLFAPGAVLDYVIIHELAHLIEMNHSARFWKIVGDIMPNYKEKEDWLKVNGHLCDF